MKKNILFVINTLGRAGAETALVSLIKKLNPEKFDISLYVCLGQGELIKEIPYYVNLLNEDDYDESSVLTAQGKRRLRERVFNMMFANGAIFKNIAYIISNIASNILHHQKISAEKLLWSVVADAGKGECSEHYDLAIAYIEGASAYYVDRYVSADKKVGFIHVDYGMAGYNRKLDRNCYDRFDRIFTVSDEVRESFVKVYPEKENVTEVFHNLIDVDAVREKAKLYVPSDIKEDSRLKLLTVCRLTPQKALETSVKAMKLLRERGVDAVWYVVGDGQEKSSLCELINKLDLEDRFILLGNRDNPYPYYLAADIYVHATKYEGKSLAIQEAQILERPVIASDCSGNREQIRDGIDGYLCEFTEEGIADAIIKMNDNRSKWNEFTQRASENVSDNSSELCKLYDLL